MIRGVQCVHGLKNHVDGLLGRLHLVYYHVDNDVRSSNDIVLRNGNDSLRSQLQSILVVLLSLFENRLYVPRRLEQDKKRFLTF